MAFDPLGTMTRARFACPTIIRAHTATICWKGIPNPIPISWIPASPYEVSALLALQNSALANKYDFYSNVPLSAIFAINIRAFLQSYKTNSHWTAGSKAIRKSALLSIRKQIGIKAVDILLCNKSGGIVGGLEIDGPHHSKQPQQTWDFSKSMLFASAKLPLLRVATKHMQPPGGGAQCGNLFLLLHSAKANWKQFVQNPSIGTMQLHQP